MRGSIVGIGALDRANIIVNDQRFIFTNLNTTGWVLIVIGAIQFTGSLSLIAGNTYPTRRWRSGTRRRLGRGAAVRGWDARAIELTERAFADCERGGLQAEAAELARGLAFLHVSVRGNRAVAMGG